MVRRFRRRCGPIFFLILICLALLSLSCSKSNNLLLGRVEANVGNHIVIVADCYRISVPPPQVLRDSANMPFHRFVPCVDADVLIDGDQLLVNGRSYGTISAGDTVIVDHGRVLVNGRAVSFGILFK